MTTIDNAGTLVEYPPHLQEICDICGFAAYNAGFLYDHKDEAHRHDQERSESTQDGDE